MLWIAGKIVFCCFVLANTSPDQVLHILLESKMADSVCDASLKSGNGDNSHVVRLDIK